MNLFAKYYNEWLNVFVKNRDLNIKEKIISNYLNESNSNKEYKSTNINVLLNRVKMNQKFESRKKLYFSAAASLGLVLFGIVLF
tara:strand:+ start:405 stop:656 length:252 start_codon:yes stop_codon:yes gene_type:complete